MRTKTNGMKRIICSILATIIMIGLIAIPTENAQAASKVKVPKALHINTGRWSDSSISIEFDHEGDYIKNLKTSSTKLKARETKIERNGYSRNYVDIGTYTSKDGTYKLSFDIYGSNDKKISSHSIKVYANKSYPLKKIHLDGENLNNMTVTDKADGKLSVALNKGYTLKKIVVQTYDQNGKAQPETVKNNSRITLGTYAYGYENVSEGADVYNYNMRTSLMAETRVIVYYTDKYTKAEASTSRIIRRPAI